MPSIRMNDSQLEFENHPSYPKHPAHEKYKVEQAQPKNMEMNNNPKFLGGTASTVPTSQGMAIGGNNIVLKPMTINPSQAEPINLFNNNGAKQLSVKELLNLIKQ